MLKIALLGAPRTGKAQLAGALRQAAEAAAWPVSVVVAEASALQADLTSCQLVLLMGLDTSEPQGPSQATAEHAADHALRAVLARASVAYRVLYGSDDARLTQALHALENLLQRIGPRTLLHNRPNRSSAGASTPQPWNWTCDKCSDPQCEHRLLTALLAQRQHSPSLQR